MTLDSLATEEERLLSHLVRGVSIAQLDQAGVFAAYRRVHTIYAGLLLDPINGAEALKRALFLQWYGWLEPLYITGIRDVDPDLQWQVMHRVDHTVGHGGIDLEFGCMLDWYNARTPWFFDEGEGLPAVGNYLARSHSLLDEGKGFPNLQTYLHTSHPTPALAVVFTPERLMHRGHMGTYFLSILQAQAR